MSDEDELVLRFDDLDEAPPAATWDDDEPIEETLRRLDALLSQFSSTTIDKARDLLSTDDGIGLVKHDGPVKIYNVNGSKPYVVRITRGDDYLYAECSCPNGVHRGGDAQCYHSIAARALAIGVAKPWVGRE